MRAHFTIHLLGVKLSMDTDHWDFWIPFIENRKYRWVAIWGWWMVEGPLRYKKVRA